MAASNHFDSVLTLGTRIVKELGVDDSVDTLGRWMAHYVAGLIQEAQEATSSTKHKKRSECAAFILELWKHRYELPLGNRPFDQWGPILSTLQELEVSDSQPHYFRPVRVAAAKDAVGPKTQKWLNAIDGVDYSARIIIRYLLVLAARTLPDQSKEWVRLAMQAGQGDDDARVLQVLIQEADAGEGQPYVMERKRLEERLARLTSLQAIAKSLAVELKKQLARTSKAENRKTRQPPKPTKRARKNRQLKPRRRR
jgi:hypothetical protein